MPPTIVQQPQRPEDLARLAGKDIYGTSVGMLRRVELWRLGNAWGMEFPAGATKDSMLPFFIQLEAQGHNPLRPPTGNLDEIVKARLVKHAGKSMAEVVFEVEPRPVAEMVEVVPLPEPEPAPRPDAVLPAPESEFELKLKAMPHAQLKKICKLRGIEQGRQDTKATLVARIVAAASAVGIPANDQNSS